jgi:hypothetical protein
VSDATVPSPREEVLRAGHVYPDEPHARRTVVLVAAAFSVLFMIFVVGLTAVNTNTIKREEGPGFVSVGWLTMGASVVAIAIIIPVVFLVRAVFWRLQLRRVEARRPGSVAFFARRTPELTDALASSALFHGRLPRQFVVTVGRSGLELWCGRSAEPRAMADPSVVDALEAGYLSVLRGRVKLPTRTLFVIGDQAGHELRLPLPPVGDHGITFASARDSNLLVDCLTQFLKLN